MRVGASVSGGAHVALLAAMALFGQYAAEHAPPVPFAEVELMSGTEFDATFSAAPTVNMDAPASLEAPTEAETRGDVLLSETDAAMVAPDMPVAPAAPDRSATPAAPEIAPPAAHIADIGEQLAAPLAPDADRLVFAAETPTEIAPAAETLLAPAPQPRAPEVDTSTPVSEPEPMVADAPPERPAPPEESVAAMASPEAPAPIPAPEPEAARAEAPEIETDSPAPPPEPAAEEPETETADIAPKVAPPPPTRPREIEVAEQATRPARSGAEAEEQGATRKADQVEGAGTTKTVGQLSFSDRDNLRVGIKSYFNPPQGVADADELAVVFVIELNDKGEIVGKPKLDSPKPPLDRRVEALARAGARALIRSASAGVFAKLPKDKYARWRLIEVTFTPREIRFL